MASSLSRWHHQMDAWFIKKPWMNWFLVYFLGILFFFCYRIQSIPILMKEFVDEADNTFGNKLAGILLGMLEDIVLMSYLVAILWIVDVYFGRQEVSTVMEETSEVLEQQQQAQAFNTTTTSTTTVTKVKVISFCKGFWRFALYFFFFLLFTLPFVADSILVRLRTTRFDFTYISLYFNEKDAASNLQVSKKEIQVIVSTIIWTVVIGLLFSFMSLLFVRLHIWSPVKAFDERRQAAAALEEEEQMDDSDAGTVFPLTPSSDGTNAITEFGNMVDKDIEAQGPPTTTTTTTMTMATTTTKSSKSLAKKWKKYLTIRNKRARTLLRTITPLVLLLTFTFTVYLIVHGTSATIAMIALNTSLNEFFKLFTGGLMFMPTLSFKDFDPTMYIHKETEEYELLVNNSIYRRTKGFKGPLAFDVQVDKDEKPNVLLLVVESFRYHDSQYLVQNNTYLLNENNITATPEFDKWAKKGIAFRNLWSSWRTSRSIESLLFGHVHLDSVTETATTGGRKDTKLIGLPQFFKQKGYETTFTTACRMDYDNWNTFIPNHGFENVYERKEFVDFGTKEMGIDWKEGRRAMSYWGPHDDVSFEMLGNMLKKKKKEQDAAGKTNRKPYFINHYTISSHTPYEERPDWYRNSTDIIPDFSPLYKNRPHANDVKNYLQMRYFTDMEFGKFMKEMEKAGVLNDTIIFVVGDHGQAPEVGLSTPEQRKVSAQRVAATLIAEGRLGESAGMMIDDAACQMDVMNTFADILGVPEDGFKQWGVGRSLKRKIPFGKRIVWANNPQTKFSAIQGHTRIEYERELNKVTVYDTEKDHEQTKDLYQQEINAKEGRKEEIIQIKNAGRQISAYFKKRWEKKCFTDGEC